MFLYIIDFGSDFFEKEKSYGSPPFEKYLVDSIDTLEEVMEFVDDCSRHLTRSYLFEKCYNFYGFIDIFITIVKLDEF